MDNLLKNDFGLPKKQPEAKKAQEESGRVVWNAEKVEQLKQDLQKGYKPKNSPFFKNQLFWRKADIAYDYSEYELNEIRRCASDIVYFAEKYCFLMTDKGYDKIRLRDYQIEMLKQFQKERWNIVLASRQIGKCAFFSTRINLMDSEGMEFDMYMGELYFYALSIQRRLTFAEKAKWVLWKMYCWSVS